VVVVGGGGGLSEVEALRRFTFAVEGVEAVEADHGVSVVQVIEDGSRRRTRRGSWWRAACN
jgi:hypothetical protein